MDEHEAGELERQIIQHKDGERIAVAAIYIFGEDYAAQNMRDNYIGQFANAGEWAQQVIDGWGALDQLPEQLRGYFDYEAYGRDAQRSGEIVEHDGFYFFNH